MNLSLDNQRQMTRYFQLRYEPGSSPCFLNPKPSTPYRSLSLGGLGWQMAAESYAAIINIEFTPVKNIEKAVHEIQDFVWQNKRYLVVYALKEGKDSSIGAVAIQLPVPINYEPRLFTPQKQSK